jgi:hypothetical protein
MSEYILTSDEPETFDWLSQFPELLVGWTDEDERSQFWRSWTSVLELPKRPYWMRVWIFQELTLAPVCVIMWGVGCGIGTA